MNQVTYNINVSDINGAGAAVLGGMLGTILTVGIILAVILIIAWWRIFEKAGEKGWKAIIPIYNVYILFRICGIKECWFWGFIGVAIVGGILSGINPPVTSTVTTANGIITVTDTSAAVDWSQHVPYLIGSIITGVASIAAAIAVSVKLAKAFGKGVGFTLGLIFLSGIFYMILGFGKAKYNKKAVNA